jgi:hypothetical protein
MAETTFLIDNLYRQAFPSIGNAPVVALDGVRDLAGQQFDALTGNSFKPGTTDRTSPPVSFGGIQAVKIQQGDELSYLGTPIFQPIRFLAGNYQVFGSGADNGKVVTARYETWRLPATTTVEFNRPHQITKSAPASSNGTTKELWAFGDWDVTIRGLILHPDPCRFPKDELAELMRWEQIADGIDVTGQMFRLLGIKRLAIDRISLSRVNGMPNVIPFQIEASSDEPLEISLLSERF